MSEPQLLAVMHAKVQVFYTRKYWQDLLRSDQDSFREFIDAYKAYELYCIIGKTQGSYRYASKAQFRKFMHLCGLD